MNNLKNNLFLNSKFRFFFYEKRWIGRREGCSWILKYLNIEINDSRMDYSLYNKICISVENLKFQACIFRFRSGKFMKPFSNLKIYGQWKLAIWLKILLVLDYKV